MFTEVHVILALHISHWLTCSLNNCSGKNTHIARPLLSISASELKFLSVPVKTLWCAARHSIKDERPNLVKAFEGYEPFFFYNASPTIIYCQQVVETSEVRGQSWQYIGSIHQHLSCLFFNVSIIIIRIIMMY